MRSLEEPAIACLERPETYSALEQWSEFETVFRVWRYPALRACSSWLLRESKDSFWIRRLEWDRYKDSAFPQGEPTIYGSEAIVLTEDAQTIIEKFRALSLQPFLNPPQFGIDGETFGVETKSYYLKCRLSWWSRPPESWQSLAVWLEETTDYFDSLLPQSTAKMNEARW